MTYPNATYQLCQFVHRFINDNYEANCNFIVSSTFFHGVENVDSHSDKK